MYIIPPIFFWTEQKNYLEENEKRLHFYLQKSPRKPIGNSFSLEEGAQIENETFGFRLGVAATLGKRCKKGVPWGEGIESRLTVVPPTTGV